MKQLGAEFFGTFWLVLGGCGSAVLAAGFPELGIGFVGVSLAFGLTVLTMAYAIGHISGCHLIRLSLSAYGPVVVLKPANCPAISLPKCWALWRPAACCI